MYNPMNDKDLDFYESLFMFMAKKVLVHKGYKGNEIKWDRTGGSNDIYMRYSYWERIKVPPIIHNILIEETEEDEDCGILYRYVLRGYDDR
tara:strand:- start:2008 stop:2280 length:273 start_codon:yes stop_codon:yes gene_type:complete